MKNETDFILISHWMSTLQRNLLRKVKIKKRRDSTNFFRSSFSHSGRVDRIILFKKNIWKILLNISVYTEPSAELTEMRFQMRIPTKQQFQSLCEIKTMENSRILWKNTDYFCDHQIFDRLEILHVYIQGVSFFMTEGNDLGNKACFY